jgi:predicted Zn-dependent peptidase
MVLNPLLDPLEMEKEREVIQEELRMTNDYPTQLVDLLIDDTMWPDQAMGRDVGGTPETVNQITVDDVRKYMERQYNPANTVVAVSGNISEEEVIDLVDHATRDWEPREALDWEPVIAGQNERVVRIEHRRTDQSHVCLGLPGLSLLDPDRYSFSLLNGLLGDGMSSRLFLNLRERQGLAYDVSSSINNFRDCGSLVVYCGVEPRKTREAVQAIVSELRGMHDEVPLQELNKAKEYAKGRLLLRMEDSRSTAAWLATQELLLGSIETVDDVVQQIDRTTTADVARVAQRVLEEDQLRLAIVGPHRGDKLLRRLLRF